VGRWPACWNGIARKDIGRGISKDGGKKERKKEVDKSIFQRLLAGVDGLGNHVYVIISPILQNHILLSTLLCINIQDCY